MDLTPSFDPDGMPKPLVLVGKNGTGKSILLSYIVDALFELAKKAYNDIVPDQHIGHSPFFKLTGGINQRFDCGFGIGLLEFSEEEKRYSYLDKTGSLDAGEYKDKAQGRFNQVLSWEKEEVIKKTVGDQKDLEKIFKQNSICYFPPNRKEKPHWLYSESLSDDLTFKSLEEDIKGILGKPIYVESCVEENKKWVLDVFLDSKVDFEELSGPDRENLVREKGLLLQSRRNIETLLKNILEDDSAKLGLGYRSNRLHRLHIQGNSYLIPSIDHLSSGQSILFNLFATIIRYADVGNINKSIKLNEIEGIIIIDEVDAHLDADLQYDVLPNLLKQFPHVQFILSTHSPIFLLGMERQYGKEGFEIIEMPDGMPITTERFSEFKKSFDFLKATKAFEEELQTKVQKLLSSSTKPMILLEGKTDLMYINKALTLLNRSDILEQIDIDQVGIDSKEGSENSGSSALEKIEKIYSKNNRLLKHKLLMLYDCEVNKKPRNEGYLFVESITKNETNYAFPKGIENLLPAYLLQSDYFLKNRNRFYRTSRKDYGFRSTTIEEFDKDEFCKWVCEERNTAEDLENFDVIIEILERFLSTKIIS